MQQLQPSKYLSTELPSASNKRLKILQSQEQQIYQAFDLQNFYQNKKLNIQSLKDRIERFKSNKYKGEKWQQGQILNKKQNKINKFQQTKNNRTLNKEITPRQFKNERKNGRNEFNRYQNSNYEAYVNQKGAHSASKKLQNIVIPLLRQHNLQEKINSQFKNSENMIVNAHQQQNHRISFIPMIGQGKSSLQNQRKMLNGKMNGTKINGQDFQNHFRDTMKQEAENLNQKRYREQKQIIPRQKQIKSNFETYQTVEKEHNNPQMKRSHYQNGFSNGRYKLNKNEPNQKQKKYNKTSDKQRELNRIRIEQQKAKKNPKTYSFKIQPMNSTKSQHNNKNSRFSREDKHKNNRSTQKSICGSQKQSVFQYNNFNKIISISSQQQLDKLQSLISQIWNLYETLTIIMRNAEIFPFPQQKSVHKYVTEVCSQRFDYIRVILNKVNNKRLNKVVKYAKLLQNVSIIYLVMQLTKKQKMKQSHIVNFIGYCTSNLIFIIKILYLLHDIRVVPYKKKDDNDENRSVKQSIKQSRMRSRQQTAGKINLKRMVQKSRQRDEQETKEETRGQKSRGKDASLMYEIKRQKQDDDEMTMSSPCLSYSHHTQHILNIISKFEIDSYKQHLSSLLDVILRMEHNNEIINIIQLKLCNQNKKDFQFIMTQYLKQIKYNRESKIIPHQTVDKNSRNQIKSFSGSAYYIFQFLAYYIAKENLYGTLPSVQVSPKPYLNLKFPYTVIIEPYEVLIYQKNKNILIRAYSQFFVESLSNYCNIIFWSEMMPDDIDPILQLFPKKQNIYYLYKYQCIYDKQTNLFKKPLDRFGGRVQNTIIIDRDQLNSKDFKSNCIQLPWRGQKKDYKLMQLYKILQPMFSKNQTLRKSLAESRVQIVSVLLKKKAGFTSKPFKHRQKFETIDNRLRSYKKGETSLSNVHNEVREFDMNESRQQQHFQLPMMIGRQQIYDESKIKNKNMSYQQDNSYVY